MLLSNHLFGHKKKKERKKEISQALIIWSRLNGIESFEMVEVKTSFAPKSFVDYHVFEIRVCIKSNFEMFSI